jgi:hypothetical protein
MVAWYDSEPSRAQLRYLKNLGYVEPVPESMAEASAAIDEMLDSGDSAAAYREILAERQERQALFGGKSSGDDQPFFLPDDPPRYARQRRPSLIVTLVAAPFIAFAYSAAAIFWLLSRVIAGAGWITLRVAGLIVWILSRFGLLAGRSVVMAAQAGRDQVIPWIGAQDWRSMATGCRAQLAAVARRVDGLLASASGDDRALFYILRFATAAAFAIAFFAAALFAFH